MCIPVTEISAGAVVLKFLLLQPELVQEREIRRPHWNHDVAVPSAAKFVSG
jgi:hypothetical protein